MKSPFLKDLEKIYLESIMKENVEVKKLPSKKLKILYFKIRKN
jgi:hypothetical protein